MEVEKTQNPFILLVTYKKNYHTNLVIWKFFPSKFDKFGPFFSWKIA
jgi:hypothetical protein